MSATRADAQLQCNVGQSDRFHTKNLRYSEVLCNRYDYTFRRSGDLSVDGSDGLVQHGFLRVRANSIEGGTSEIMRNILGEQVLGLPGEPRVDKDVPWADVPRN